MKPLLRIRFRCYIISCIEAKESDGDPFEFPITDIENRNPDQVPDELWQQLVLNHIVYEDFS